MKKATGSGPRNTSSCSGQRNSLAISGGASVICRFGSHNVRVSGTP
jgi:hypothetical protein